MIAVLPLAAAMSAGRRVSFPDVVELGVLGPLVSAELCVEPQGVFAPLYPPLAEGCLLPGPLPFCLPRFRQTLQRGSSGASASVTPDAFVQGRMSAASLPTIPQWPRTDRPTT